MTPELQQIRDEIADLSILNPDIHFLEALVNNAIYCLSNHQKKDLQPRSKQAIGVVITDLLNTLTKEIQWAKEENENENFAELEKLFTKAKGQILSDIDQLF
ncbi:MAG: hypothetical protein MK207_14740 [Saprospiraceae bacterium]|nr:hypothetical protein [Saprospiraceae bacterium]